MFSSVDSTILKYDMLSDCKAIIVGLSGGADSMCLLHFLAANAKRYGVDYIVAAHLNHCIRGEEAERDADFVKEQCRIIGVECYVKSVKIAELAQSKKIGLEECGRQERYTFFNEVIDKINDKFNDKFVDKVAIATAHTASDNAETVILNITRGCGTEGLTGIPAVRGNIIRPLINITRAQVEEYCEQNNVPFITDSTNLTDEYSRNKIRLNVLPELKKINPSVESAVNRMASIVAATQIYIERNAKQAYELCKMPEGLNVDKLKSLDCALLYEIIKLSVKESFNIIPEKKHIDLIFEIITASCGAVEVKKNCFVKIANGCLQFIKEERRERKDLFLEVSESAPEEFRLELKNNFFIGGKHYIVSDKIPVKILNEQKINKKLLNNLISCDIISCDITLRNRKSGDFFSPFGRKCTKTVKKLFTELKIPQNERSSRLMLADGSKILWIEGIGVSQEAALTDESEYYFTIEEEYKNE